MKHSIKIGFLSLSVAVMLTLAAVQLGNAKPQNPVVSAQDASALSTVAEYTFGRVDLAHALLLRHGYQPTVETAVWRQFPSVRKLETAYIAAEKADPGRGGEKLLALLASDLARQYESIRSEPSLQPYLQKRNLTPIRFQNPDALSPRPALPQSVEAAIDTISQYCARGPAGTPQSILRTHFHVSEETAYRLLRESSSNAEALKRAMTYVPEQQRAPLLKGLVSQLAGKYEAVRYEPALLPFLGSDGSAPSPLAPSAGPGPSVSPGGSGAPSPAEGPRPPVPPRPPSAPSAAERYPTFVSENYPMAESMSFSVMTEVIEGFGGIVFGNAVSADPSLPKIVAISFETSTTSDRGALVYEFANHDPLRFGNVRMEDAYAAYHIVYQPFAGVGAFQPGRGIGLVSLEENTPSIACDNASRTVKETTRFNVVLHPALANLDLGWAAVMVDSLPIEPELISRSVIESGLEKEQALAIKNLFLSMETPSFAHNWKVIDVPLRIGLDHDSLTVSNSAEDSSIPAGLRRTAFIEMRPMLQKGFNPRFARDFYDYVPILTKGSRDYERLNAFAAVLAVVRLAKIEGASFTVTPPVPTRVPTPDAIQLTDKGIGAVSSFVYVNALKREASKAEACLQAVLKSSPQLHQKVDELKELEVELDSEALKIYQRTDLTKDQKGLAITLMAERYEPQLDTKQHEIASFPAGTYVIKLFSFEDQIDELIAHETQASDERSSQRHAQGGNSSTPMR